MLGFFEELDCAVKSVKIWFILDDFGDQFRIRRPCPQGKSFLASLFFKKATAFFLFLPFSRSEPANKLLRYNFAAKEKACP